VRVIDMNEKQLARMIDHTLLKPQAVRQDIHSLCQQAKEFEFCTVCINPRWVSYAADLLHGSCVGVASVVGFPLGTDSTKIKAAQTKEAIFSGSDEIDMVADLSAVIEGDQAYLRRQFHAVLKVCRSVRPLVSLKVIIECAALTDVQKQFVCQVAQAAGVDYIKTSTGFHPAGGAALEDVQLIKQEAPHCRIKAAGGIGNADLALAFIRAGAHRIGTSAGVDIIQEFRAGGTASESDTDTPD
jgi:deoxyribose-phosphate aldolase